MTTVETEYTTIQQPFTQKESQGLIQYHNKAKTDLLIGINLY